MPARLESPIARFGRAEPPRQFDIAGAQEIDAKNAAAADRVMTAGVEIDADQ
jgi:hypothetical protein